MLFYDGIFLYFIVGTLLATALARTVRQRTLVLTLASYLFYAAWSWKFLFLIFGSTALDFFVAGQMPTADKAKKKLLLTCSLVANLGALAVFKYLDFGIESFNRLLGADFALTEWTLPVGISFFTFQSMSYTVDVYRGHLKPHPRFLDFIFFVSFFPQLVAGPIIRASSFLPQITSALTSFPKRGAEAIPLFVLGLFKKLVIADNLGLIVDEVYGAPLDFSSADVWMATLAFAGQIYCDFSGYTDMALALCILFGFNFPLNFRSPYFASGPQDFWRRWHISLSTWLRDYVYLPLGGSRRGTLRLYGALMATMLLGGLWHGAGWTFVLWGFFHGALLVGERLIKSGVPDRARALAAPAGRILFLLLTLVGWMIFRADSAETLGILLGKAQGFADVSTAIADVVIPAIAFIVIEHSVGEFNRERAFFANRTYLTYAGAGILLLLTVLMRPATSPPFIYFQF